MVKTLAESLPSPLHILLPYLNPPLLLLYCPTLSYYSAPAAVFLILLSLYSYSYSYLYYSGIFFFSCLSFLFYFSCFPFYYLRVGVLVE